MAASTSRRTCTFYSSTRPGPWLHYVWAWVRGQCPGSAAGYSNTMAGDFIWVIRFGSDGILRCDKPEAEAASGLTDGALRGSALQRTHLVRILCRHCAELEAASRLMDGEQVELGSAEAASRLRPVMRQAGSGSHLGAEGRRTEGLGIGEAAPRLHPVTSLG